MLSLRMVKLVGPGKAQREGKKYQRKKCVSIAVPPSFPVTNLAVLVFIKARNTWTGHTRVLRLRFQSSGGYSSSINWLFLQRRHGQNHTTVSVFRFQPSDGTAVPGIDHKITKRITDSHWFEREKRKHNAQANSAGTESSRSRGSHGSLFLGGEGSGGGARHWAAIRAARAAERAWLAAFVAAVVQATRFSCSAPRAAASSASVAWQASIAFRVLSVAESTSSSAVAASAAARAARWLASWPAAAGSGFRE